MTRIEVRGIAIVKAKGREYHYAWRGGPRLNGEPGSAEYLASYIEAHESLKVSDDGRFRALVNLYRSSTAFTNLAETTRRQWAPWLDRIGEHFGPLRIGQFNRIDKIRPLIRKWRQCWAETPRTADYGM